jgi:hypothetical protein
MKLVMTLFVLAACGSKGPPHWKDQAIETQSGAIDGVKFTIDLPKGMEKSKVESKYGVDWQYHQDGRAYAPMLSVSHLAKKQTLDEGLGSTKVNIKADRQPDGWVFVTENSSQKGKDDYIVEAQKYVGDGALSCHARVYAMRKGEDVMALVPLVEKMCLSLKVQP